MGSGNSAVAFAARFAFFPDIFRREAPSASRPDAAGADGTGARRSGELRAAASLSFLSSFDIFCWNYLSSAPRGRPGRTADALGERDPFFLFLTLVLFPHVWIIFPCRGGSNLFRSSRGGPCRRSEDAGDPTTARSSLLSLFWSVFPRFGRNRLPGPSSPYCVCAVRHTMRALLGLRMRAGSLLFLFSQVIAVASLAQTGRCRSVVFIVSARVRAHLLRLTCARTPVRCSNQPKQQRFEPRLFPLLIFAGF